MGSTRDVSIIICTRNHARSLKETLASLGRMCVPAAGRTEAIIVDNGSTDNTAELVRGCGLPAIDVRYLSEPRVGKGYAYNAGIAAARGEVLLFTDDDVRLPTDWIARMSEPIVSQGAGGVAGGVALPAHLQRPWMQPYHRNMLASTEGMERGDPFCMVGANMAIARAVFDDIQGFDPELGPGALGFCEEVLLSFQMKEAGMRIAPGYESVVEHHFDPDRLTKAEFIERARKEGRSLAYISYHWEHRAVTLPAGYVVKRSLRLALWRATRGREWRFTEKCLPEWELRILSDLAYYRQFMVEQRRPRSYERRGLNKNDHQKRRG